MKVGFVLEKRSFLKFLIDILFNLTPKDGQWKEKNIAIDLF